MPKLLSELQERRLELEANGLNDWTLVFGIDAVRFFWGLEIAFTNEVYYSPSMGSVTGV
jgi:hypothetical protein